MRANLLATMHLAIACSVLAIGAHASDPGPRPGRKSGMTVEYCYTSYGSSRHVPVPTALKTYTATYDVTKTIHRHPTTTITPEATTTTITTTSTETDSTTASTQTDTAYEYYSTTETTTTTLDTSTAIETATTSTDTTSYYVSTVTAVSGFLPLQSTLPNSNYKKKRAVREPLAGSLQARSRHSKHQPQAFLAQGAQSDAKHFPEMVRCNIFINTASTISVTSTKSTATVMAPTPTSTSTASTVTTTTVTIVPGDASTTISITSTTTTTISSTPLTTTTTTVTNTNTVSEPTSTFYAECSNSNMASTGPTGALVQLQAPNGGVTSTSDSSYDCCVSCLLNPICAAGAFALDGSGTCYANEVAPGATCTSPTQYQLAIRQYSSDTPYYEYFNGNCAQISSYD